MIALDYSNLMHHGKGVIIDSIAAILGLAVVAPQLRTFILSIDASWLSVFGALGAVIVGRAIDIIYKEIRAARRRRKRLPNDKQFF